MNIFWILNSLCFSRIDFKFLEQYTKTVNLEELLNIFPKILNGEIAGRVLLDLNK